MRNNSGGNNKNPDRSAAQAGNRIESGYRSTDGQTTKPRSPESTGPRTEDAIQRLYAERL
jgi:hypothetical protein